MAHFRHSVIWPTIAACVIAFAVGGCSSSGSSDGAGEQLSAEQVLVDAASAMAEVETASFTIEQTGATVYIDDGNQLAFQAAEGRFASPGSSDALLTVEAFGFTTEVGAIAVDGDLWFTNPLTGDWTEAPDSFTFDPATLFAPDTGFPALLNEAVATATLLDEPPTTDDTDRSGQRGVRATVDASRVAVLTGGLVTQESEVDVWIDAETGRVVEVLFDLDLDGAVSDWRMTLGDYGADVTISPPELSPGG